MPLLNLPTELILEISKDLETKDLYSLLRANRYLSVLLSPSLLKHAIQTDRHFVTALFFATANKNEKMIRLLLEECEVSIVIGKAPTLYSSICLGCRSHKAVEYLIENGANSIIQDLLRGGTALHWAAELGHKAIFESLLKKGASTEIRDLEGGSVLSWAAYGGSSTIVRLLFEHGVDINDGSSLGAIHIAAAEGHEELVKLFLDNGAAIDVQNNLEETPLLVAVTANEQDVVKSLLLRGANINTMDNMRNSVLHRAAFLDDDTMTILLLEGGAFPFFQNLLFQMPIDIAKERGFSAGVRALEYTGFATLTNSMAYSELVDLSF
ncbi:uncharacterized protein H6S33_005804 [Morchella sextelata]|jgi:ankyrin repeat protein|uniref:uncharacterized protein n=1 Tax=Morchella sextelata TaxID=1174677 RepID=UPI001D03FB6D|nr:uncharacterized protein H6S33_005804 [Morchella sextelata]KAH0613918.1 hypothetical protein H6S33_005804 [Morchella sextelata]